MSSGTRIYHPRLLALLALLALALSPAQPARAVENFTDSGAGLPGDIASGAEVAWGDYDSDGDLDLAVVGGYNSQGSPGATTSAIYRNNGGSFASINAGLPGVFSGAVAWADYDSDGDLDLTLAGYWDVIGGPVLRIYRNTNGAFADAGVTFPGIPYGLQVPGLAWGDYDGDGDLDLAASGAVDNSSDEVSRIYRNDGGSFVDLQAGLIAVVRGSLEWGDYDNDGDLDLLLSGEDSSNVPTTQIYRNTGGTFANINAGLPGVTMGKAAWGDHDNDGDLDVALSGFSAGSVPLRAVYTNNGGAFVVQFSASGGGASGKLAWGDYDNDGDLDLLIIGETGALGNVLLYRNNGGGSFTGVSDALPAAYVGSAAWGDYDNDGDLDLTIIACTSYYTAPCTASGFWRIYRNNGNPANSPPTAPGGLQAAVAGNQVTLSWSASSDSATAAAGLSYNLRVGTAPGSGNVMAPMANTASGYRRLPQRGNVDQHRSRTLTLPYGTYYWSVQAIDSAFAGSAWAAEGSFTLAAPPPPDTTAPVGTIKINDTTAVIGSTNVTLFLSASDSGGSGLKEMRFSNDGATWGAWEPYSTFRIYWSLPPGDGVKTVYAQFRDNAGNVSAVASDTIILDTTRPDVINITINGGAQFTNTPDVSVSVMGSDTNDLNLVQLSNRPDTTLGRLAYAKGYTYAKGAILGIPWSLADEGAGGSAANGPRSVYVQFRDVANNWSLVGSDSIFLDTVAPEGTLTINGGAATTGSVNVTLDLAANDPEPGAGVAEMRLSNDGATWGAWEPFAPSKAWTLAPGTGSRSVSAQFRDNAGNVSATAEAVIVVEITVPDTVAPSGSVTINGGAATTSDPNVTLTLAASDPEPGAGVAEMRLSNDGATWGAWEPFTPSKAWTLAPGTGSRSVSVQFRDNAGNVSATAEAVIVVETEPAQVQYRVLLPLLAR